MEQEFVSDESKNADGRGASAERMILANFS